MSISKLLWIIAITTTLSVNLVFAQKTNTKARLQSQPASSASPEKSRARRTVSSKAQSQAVTTDAAKAGSQNNEAAPQSAPASATTSTEAQPSQASLPAKTVESAPQEQAPSETVAEPEATKSDPIVELREQIDVANNPQDRIRLQLQLADLLVSNSKKSEAVAELHSVTATDVFDPQGFYNTGNALARLGDTQGAINAYRKAIDQRKGRYSRALNNLGVILLRAGRWDEAYSALASALKIENFRYAEASYNLGRLYSARGQMDLATREWRRAIQVNPEHTAAVQLLARAGDDGGITVERPPTVARHVRSRATSSAVVAPERPEKSSTPGAAPQRLTLDPTSFAFLQKARSAAENGMRLEAVDNYRRLITRENGYFAPANLELAFVFVGLNRDQEALTALLQVMNRDGSSYPIGYYHIARIYERQGELKLAEEAFLQAIAAYGNQNGQFMLDLSRVREKQGNFPGAAEAMEQFIAAMKKEGLDPTWSEERLNSLRQKASAPQ